jgi:acylaminoacyl-peptidase
MYAMFLSRVLVLQVSDCKRRLYSWLLFPPVYVLCLVVVRSVRDIDAQKRRKYLYTIPAKPSWGALKIPPSELHDTIQFRLPSPSGNIIAVFRDESKNGKESPTLEIWKQNGQALERRISLSREGYGKVISDPSGGFGVPSWDTLETAIVFTMEQKAIESQSYFERSRSRDTDSKKPINIGGQNELGVGKVEHWGEKYSNQSPLFGLFCVNIETGKIAQVHNVPGREMETTDSSRGGYALGQAVFHPLDGKSIVYTGWDAGGGEDMPRRLGLVYCQQRPCRLYLSIVGNLLQKLATVGDDCDNMQGIEDNGKDLPFFLLTPNHQISHSPRFAPTVPGETAMVTKLAFLTSKKGFDTHSGCFALGLMDLVVDYPLGTVSIESKILVSEVWDPSESSLASGRVAGLGFPGMYALQLPVSCFVSPKFLVATTQWGSCLKTVRVSMQDGTVRLISIEGNDEYSSDELLCAVPGCIVVSSKTPGKPGVVHAITSEALVDTQDAHLALSAAQTITFEAIASSVVSSLPSPVPHNFTCTIRVSDAPPVNGVTCNHSIQSVLMLPNTIEDEKPPLIVVPHGGPHSVSSTSYIPSYAFLCGYGGYALLFVNYRGSTGFGQSSIEALPTNIGTLDVQDVMSATEAVKNSGLVDANKIFVCGGSHGGFLVAHVTSQFPEYFRAAGMRNPVVNIGSMVTSTDIPDWCHIEATGSYDWQSFGSPSLEEMTEFYKKSPTQYIKRVRTPTLVALGMKDLRVPPSQGLEWYHALRSMGVATKLLMYDTDDHAIDGAGAEADHWVSLKRWFDQYL